LIGHIEYMMKRLKEEEDMVNSPAHYNKESVTGDGFEAYLQGNILKYLCRYKYKNGVEDLRKANWYLNRLINKIGEDEDGI